MTNIPTTRQLAPPPLRQTDAHAACGEALAQAFSTFNQAAGSLESTYLALNDEVALLRRELAGTHRQLRSSLAEHQRTRLHLEDILRCLPCGVVVTNERGRLLRSNPAARLLLSRLPERDPVGGELAEPGDWNPLTDSRPSLFMPAAFASATETETDYELPATGPGAAPLTYGICRSKVSQLSAELTLSTSQYFPELSADSEFPVGPAAESSEWVYILRDLTPEKTLLREQESARRLTSLAEVSAVLAHEIRNPLASLELFAGLIAKSALPGSEQSVWITHIRAGLRSLSGTVNNVLQLYSQSAPEALPLDLNDLLAQTADFLQPLAEQWQVRIVSELPATPCRVQGVLHQLQQVLLNIAMNAFRVSPPGGTLRIRLEPGEPTAAITISDDGPGIPAGLAEQIFEPGFSTRPDSPGIGLAVSRRIIEQHGGTLSAAVLPPGCGASFVITLPRPAGGTAHLTHSMSLSNDFESHELTALTR